MRFFAGISGLWLQQKIEADFAGTALTAPLTPFTFDITTRAKYKAIGLRFGMEGEYQGWCNINPVSMLATTLFIGREEPATNSNGTSALLTAGGIPENFQSISHHHYTQIVPSFDGKLGLKYSGLYSPGKEFAIEVGYMASIYINALQNYVPSTFVPDAQTPGITTGSFFLQSLLKATESFSVDGPYATVSVKF
jgi:hypothetical protein